MGEVLVMTVQVAEQWAADMESGRFRKGKGRLCARGPDVHEQAVDAPVCHCALGVLAETHGMLASFEEMLRREVEEDPATEWLPLWTGIIDVIPDGEVLHTASIPESRVEGLTDAQQNQLYLLSDEAEDFGPAVAWVRAQILAGVWS